MLSIVLICLRPGRAMTGRQPPAKAPRGPRRLRGGRGKGGAAMPRPTSGWRSGASSTG